MCRIRGLGTNYCRSHKSGTDTGETRGFAGWLLEGPGGLTQLLERLLLWFSSGKAIDPGQLLDRLICICVTGHEATRRAGDAGVSNWIDLASKARSCGDP